MPSQFSSEFINQGQMSGMQNSGVFSPYPGQQSIQRQAFMSPVQGDIGESPQIQFLNYLEGTPMMMQGSPQSQLYEVIDNFQYHLIRAGYLLELWEAIQLNRQTVTDFPDLKCQLQILLFSNNHPEEQTF